MEKKQGAFRTTIGGQALIEGILMRGPEKDAIVVRSPEGLVTKVTERKFIRSKYPILGVPILRGAVTFISSMITGVKALMFSADYFPDEEDAQPGKFDQWLEKHIPAEKLQSLVVAFSVILSLALTLVLFMLLPTFVAGLFHAKSAAVHNIIEGVVKVAIFLGYLILLSVGQLRTHPLLFRQRPCRTGSTPANPHGIRQRAVHPGRFADLQRMQELERILTETD